MYRALERARELDFETVQVFVKSPHQWKAQRPRDGDVEAFERSLRSTGIGPVVAHAAYLVNLASPDRAILGRSRRGLIDELERCSQLGIDGLIVHPGAHLGSGVARGVERIAASVDHVLSRARGREGGRPRLLLENTAGQGSVLGASLEELAEILERCGDAEGLGICVDTCHAFAAGYDLRRSKGYEAFWRRLDELLGIGAVGCLHLNDSAHPLGSRRDRHANLGEGEIGAGLFRRLMGDPRLARVAMILETPAGQQRQGHARDLERLRRWRQAAGR